MHNVVIARSVLCDEAIQIVMYAGLLRLQKAQARNDAVATSLNHAHLKINLILHLYNMDKS